MTKSIKKIGIFLFALMFGFSCFVLVGCESETSATIQLSGTVASVKVNGTLDEALAKCTLQILKEDGSGYENVVADDGTVATGYANMRKAGAFITWDGSSADAKAKQTNGKQLVISITYNLETISVNYTIN